MKTLHLDFETVSGVDLKKVGVENYVRHPDFAVTVVGWSFDDNSVSALYYPHVALPPEVRAHIQAGGIVKAWNAAFEWNILTYHYGLNVEHEQMDCVMQRALAFGLPAGLEKAGEALKAPIIKDATARRLMLTMGKAKKDGSYWHLDQSLKAVVMLKDLSMYCVRDVEAERALDKMIPPLAGFEKKLSVIDGRINQSGVPIDLVGVLDLKAAAEEEVRKINAECDVLTGGAVKSPGTETAKLMAWLHAEGCGLPDLTKETVAAQIKLGQPQYIQRVLELRQLAAKASVAKLAMMQGWASVHDGRARNLLQFYGAGRTGRWAGRGIQVQNLPRPDKGLVPQRVMDLAHCDAGALGLFYPQPMRAISGSLRGCLTARPEHVLVSIDLSQIEARVGAWLAGQTSILDAVKAYDAGTGPDIYVYAAAQQGSTDRQFGKVLSLACQFAMGKDRFLETAADYGVTLTLSEADAAVFKWREQHQAIKFMWWDLENMALALLGYPNPRIKRQFWTLKDGIAAYRGIMMTVRNGTLLVRKPNGCKLTYHNPHVKVSDDGGRMALKFDGVGENKRWGEQKLYGGRIFENLVQSIARDVMAEGIVASGRIPIMTIHDEIVWEVPEAGHDVIVPHLRGAVEQGATWTFGLPLASDVKISWRFGK